MAKPRSRLPGSLVAQTFNRVTDKKSSSILIIKSKPKLFIQKSMALIKLNESEILVIKTMAFLIKGDLPFLISGVS